ncbi:MAG: hypothetical protein F7C38_01690 [Desulfurococcales archaeon]|nr:hypothetical protein [Desulfurococcales archaeon]
MPELELKIPRNGMVRISGPAEIVIREGSLVVLGAELAEGDRLSISEYRSYALKALEDTRILVGLGGQGRIEWVGSDTEPLEEWVSIAEAVIDSCTLPCRVAIIGPVDSGKTSFTALLANRALARGVPVAVIDSDVGQADIGPPGFISLSIPSDWILWLRELEPGLMRFIGSIEPAPVVGRIVSQTSILVERAEREGVGLSVVDTDGWVEGWNALEYKGDLVRAADIDRIVVLGDPGLYEFFQKLRPGGVYYARSPVVRVSRDASDRRNLRSMNYRRFLEGGFTREIDLRGVSVFGSCLFSSQPFGGDGIKSRLESTLGKTVEYIGRYPGGYCLVVDTGEESLGAISKAVQRELSGDVIILDKFGFKGVLVGLSDGTGDYPAVVEDVDLDRRVIRVKTRYRGDVEAVFFGRIRLEGYREVPKRRIWI